MKCQDGLNFLVLMHREIIYFWGYVTGWSMARWNHSAFHFVTLV